MDEQLKQFILKQIAAYESERSQTQQNINKLMNALQQEKNKVEQLNGAIHALESVVTYLEQNTTQQ